MWHTLHVVRYYLNPVALQHTVDKWQHAIVKLQYLYSKCHIKVSIEPHTNARTCWTPVCIALDACTNWHRKYASTQSMPVFVNRQISARRCESFGMFVERSTCYSCLSSVRACGLVFPFQSVHRGLCFSGWYIQVMWSRESLFTIFARRTSRKSLNVLRKRNTHVQKQV